MDWPHMLIFTEYAPPSLAASSQVLERLISGAEEHFGFVSKSDGLSRESITSEHFPVRHDYGGLFQKSILWRFEKFAWYRAAVNEGLKQTTNQKWNVILSCHPDMAFTLAAAKVARVRGLPFVLYLMDLFSESRTNPVEKIWSRLSEKRLIKDASIVLCLTEGLQKHYANKYQISPVLIPHCVTEQEIGKAIRNKPSLDIQSPLIMSYAGGVYQARLDSLLAVKQAIDQLNAQGYSSQLHILGKNDTTQLASWGISGEHVRVRFLKDRDDFMDALRRSDILLSTIAFQSDYPLQDQTCFPTKTLDYFLAGKPILVVAPDTSDYVVYLKRSKSAMVVSTLNSDIVADYIQKLVSSLSLRRRLVEAGFNNLNAQSKTNIQLSLKNVLEKSLAHSLL